VVGGTRWGGNGFARFLVGGLEIAVPWTLCRMRFSFGFCCGAICGLGGWGWINSAGDGQEKCELLGLGNFNTCDAKYFSGYSGIANSFGDYYFWLWV